MKIIHQENDITATRSSLILIVFGTIVFLIGKLQHNEASTFLGLSFGILSFLCFLLIRKGHSRIARISWGLFTPILLFLSTLFFSIGQPIAIITYGYLYIAGMMYSAGTFHYERDKWPIAASTLLYFLGMMAYDSVIIERNFSQEPWALFVAKHYEYFKAIQAFHFASLFILVMILKNNKTRIETKLGDQIIKLKELTSGLITISQNHIVHSGDLSNALKEILRYTAQTINVSRISVWEYREDKNAICTVLCYDSATKSFSDTGMLNKCDYPVYFKYLLEEKVINTYDAVHDEKTKEFASSYLTPNGIKSMMDSPFFIDGIFKGILCYEEQRQKKLWDEVDELFSLTISKLISIAYYCHMRKEQFDILKTTNEDLANKNSALETINQKVMEIADDMAHNVISQGAGIEELNKFIDDISFRNSHHVRAPLSRILGLIQLYKYDQDNNAKALYMEYIEKSAAELDGIIRDIAITLRSTRNDWHLNQ